MLHKKNERNTKDRKLTSNVTILTEKMYIRMLPAAWRNLWNTSSAPLPSLRQTRTLYCGSLSLPNYVLKDLKPVSVVCVGRGENLQVSTPPLPFHVRLSSHTAGFTFSGECMTILHNAQYSSRALYLNRILWSWKILSRDMTDLYVLFYVRVKYVWMCTQRLDGFHSNSISKGWFVSDQCPVNSSINRDF